MAESVSKTLIIFVTFSIFHQEYKSERNHDHNLIWISLDGFSDVYWTEYRYELKFLRRFREESATASSLIPEFYTKTFPNHMSQATGVLQDSHGMVSNEMYNRKSKSFFSHQMHDETWWDLYRNVTPIWVTNQEYDGQKSATIYWPGSNVKFQNTLPDFYFSKYIEESANTRLEYARKLLQTSKYNLVMIYISDVDMIGHDFGPKSSRMAANLRSLDQTLSDFVNYVHQLPKKYHIMISSDHGMADMQNSKMIYLTDYVTDISQLIITSSGPAMMIYINNTDDSHAKFIQAKLVNVEGIKVYLKSQVPKHLNYNHHPHISDLVIIASSGYCIVRDRHSGKDCLVGNHGYLPDEPASRGIFLLHGTTVRSNYVHSHIRSVDLYFIACRVMDLKKCHGIKKWRLYDKFFISNGYFQAFGKRIFMHFFLSSWVFGVFILITIVFGTYNSSFMRLRRQMMRIFRNERRMNKMN